MWNWCRRSALIVLHRYISAILIQRLYFVIYFQNIKKCNRHHYRMWIVNMSDVKENVFIILQFFEYSKNPSNYSHIFSETLKVNMLGSRKKNMSTVLKRNPANLIWNPFGVLLSQLSFVNTMKKRLRIFYKSKYHCQFPIFWKHFCVDLKFSLINWI